VIRYRILCVGKRAKDPLLDSADDYSERLSRYARVELLRVKDASQEDERDALAAKIRDGARVIALDERGAGFATKALAQQLGTWERHGLSAADFLIGGADGLHPDLLARADDRWALSALTLPHRLALVLLLEQLYRAHTILRGEPYHRA
jgi:23S rRNA (pseudouridine1915-N3)-methyltransferase